MKSLLVAVLSIFLLADAQAARAKISGAQVNALIAKLKGKHSLTAKKIRALGEPLAKISISPKDNPAQESKVSLFVLASGITDSDVLVDGLLDGNPVALEHPAQNLWVYNAGAFSEIRSHEFKALVSIQDHARAAEIVSAVQALDSDIQSIDQQLAEASDPQIIAQLTAERAQKVASKNNLLQALANLKTSLGEESLKFNITEAQSLPGYPKIVSVTPNAGPMSGGGFIHLSGINFGTSAEVKIGGVSVATSNTDSDISFVCPSFTTEGPKDVEVRRVVDGEVRNTVFKSGFFASSQPVGAPSIPPTAPTGIAEAVTPQVALGSVATVTAQHSYDVNNQPLAFEWRLVSKAQGSALPIDTTTPASTATDYSFTPDVPGFYVLELRTSETTVPFMTGNTSVAVVEAVAPANRAPVGSAPGITASYGMTRTSQVLASDPDAWQQRTLLLTKQSAYGNATLSSAGLVSFQAGANSGSDAIEVTVVDNGTPPLSTVVSIPVTVVENLPPVFNAGILARQKTEGLPYQARLSQNISSNGTVDPDGTISEIWWDFGDGTREKTIDRNSNYLFHNYMATGAYTVTVTATDNLGASTSQSTTLNIVDTDIPTAKFKASSLFGTFPLTVSFDASESADADGIVQYQWYFAGSPASNFSTTPFMTHTYNTPGTYSVRLRTIDAYGVEGETNVPVTVGTSSGSMLPQSIPQISPRMVTLGGTIDFLGGRSFIGTVGASLVNYNWTTGDFYTCPANNCSVNSENTSWTYPVVDTFYPGLLVTDSLGASSPVRYQVETIVVNSGTPPRAVLRAPSFNGVAPFTLNVDGSESYVYSGGAPIAAYNIYWGDGTGSGDLTVPTASHAFSTPGVYTVVLNVIDANGNRGAFPQTVIVAPSKAELAAMTKKLDETPADPEREYQRQLLSGACGQGDAQACYGLGKMYGEDGNEFAKQKLWEKACNMGYEPACTLKKKGK